MNLLVIVLALASFSRADSDAEITNDHLTNPLLVKYIYGKHHVRNIEPQIRVTLTDVEYDLYTPNNKDLHHLVQSGNVVDLSSSHFDPTRLTVFVVHGWTQNRKSELNVLLREALFENFNVNLFVVDWSGPASKLYPTAVDAVVPVGQLVGNFINDIQSTYGVDGSNFVLIGHSLGAHVVGSAGATANNKIQNIIGLDPAGPYYPLEPRELRLDTTDGEYVQVIHTNGKLLGMEDSIGHVDYYPNGGMSQPGCGLDLTGVCSHMKCYRYLAEAIRRGASVFRAKQCNNYTDFKNGVCANNEESLMGEIVVSARASGDYYLNTNTNAPFGQA